MAPALIVARRELAAYFATPVAYVFIVIFLVLSGALTFTLGNFFARGQADLIPFFSFVPWLFLFLVPALTMRLWAEERRLGTIELLLTLPLPQWQAVLGKFLAAWAFCGIALALTFPLWITVNVLGEPDNGVILSGYIGCLLVAGAYLAVGAAVSALTRNQVVAFVLAVAICFVFTAAGSPVVGEFLDARIPGIGGGRPRHLGGRPLWGLHPRRRLGPRYHLLRQLHGLLPLRECRHPRPPQGGLGA
ncbi:ABC transporter permease [Siccirubricoccus sp. G192]|uniref:ABC transporter permease n=1 Tax=Siccirubricoccus sp. G192 TaxID=2849651 RepID=UPI0020C307B8|nr:ABC transporter permease subunit [Siccirubricoccus sp. G192]